MSFQLSYNLTQETIRNLEFSSAGDGFLQVLRMNPEWAVILERKARIKEAIGSIGIEGTVVTAEQARAITEGDESIPVGEKERREFVGYSLSLSYVRERADEELGLGLLMALHKKVTQGDIKANPGKLRTDLRSVKRHGRKIYTAPPPEQLSFLLRDFFRWFNTVAAEKMFSPVVAAAICHFWFVWIHPFADGNGRVARLLTTFLLLKKRSEGVKYFALSDFYNRDLDGYYDTLEKVNVCNPDVPSMNFDLPLTVWIVYFVQSYSAQMSSAKGIASRILQLKIRVDHLRSEKLISAKHEEVLAFLSAREKASYAELQAHLGGVTQSYVTQVLKPLRDAKILAEESIGGRKWFKLGAPEDEPDETVLKQNAKRKHVRRQKVAEHKQAVFPIFED